MRIKVAFFGSDKYSFIVLEILKKNPHLEIVKTIRNKNDLDNLTSLPQPDLGIVASFGTIIPQEIINWPKKGLLNLHPSLLPKYRGSTPIPTAILNNEKETGLTIIKVDEKVDHGLIVSQFKEAIGDNETSDDLLKRLFSLGAKNLIKIIPDYFEDRIKLQEQNHKQATFTQKLTRDSGKIDWSKPTDFQERFIRAMFPWPGAWTEVNVIRNTKDVRRETENVKRLKILKAHLEGKKLVLDLVQLEGKNPVTWKQFLEGYPQVGLPF